MKIQISNGMFIALIINMVYPKAVGVTQGIMAREVDGDFWLSTVFATIQGVLAILMVVWLIKRTPDKNIFDQSEILLGKWGGKIVSLLIFLFFLGAFGSVMITFVYHMMDYFMP
ncbi:GerAB/ArcD/ProY family transporter, partial [Brevibacillus sp. SYSU BS000544]|uniref:GerAB/ArcD/ProY family transporter n=1 Tax=Brevibacillus sp. SYSU BS000544 TaxID=3416443 RepID=UPI003CE44FA7